MASILCGNSSVLASLTRRDETTTRNTTKGVFRTTRSTATAGAGYGYRCRRVVESVVVARRGKGAAAAMAMAPTHVHQQPMTTNPSACRQNERRRRRRGAIISAAVSEPEEAVTDDGAVSRSLEFMVEMACGKCVASVESAVSQVPGVEAVVATLGTNTVRVVATTTTADEVTRAIESSGFNCRLIGQGDVDVFGEDLAERLGTDLRTLKQSLAAVAEFKGEAYGHGSVTGVVRFVAVNEEIALIEGELAGLTPGPHALVIHQYGDTSKGVDTVGSVYEGEEVDVDGGVEKKSTAVVDDEDKAGHLGSVTADAEGNATIPSRVVDSRLKVWNFIGRSLAVHDAGATGLGGDKATAAVLARSAGVGENLKKVCQCDGTVIWESSPDDFKPAGSGA